MADDKSITSSIGSGIISSTIRVSSLAMAPVPETPGPRKVHENALRRMAERQQMRLVKSARRDPRAWDYNTYTLFSRAGDGPTVLEHASLQEIDDYLHMGRSEYERVPQGKRIDAPEGTIVGVMPGVIIDNLKSGKRFQVDEDGGFIELGDDGWVTVPDDDR